jgi:hyperosmotically inducible protein
MKSLLVVFSACLILEGLIAGCTTPSQDQPASKSNTARKDTGQTSSAVRKPLRDTTRDTTDKTAVDKATSQSSPDARQRAIPSDEAVLPDDTANNVRDREGKTLTPMDQSSDPKDIEITRQIRKAVMADDTLSTTAKNIKIITIDGTATLRGPVESSTERINIGKKANVIAPGKVNNQLEVTVR